MEVKGERKGKTNMYLRAESAGLCVPEGVGERQGGGGQRNPTLPIILITGEAKLLPVTASLDPCSENTINNLIMWMPGHNRHILALIMDILFRL